MTKFDDNVGRSFVHGDHGDPIFCLCDCDGCIIELDTNDTETDNITCRFCRERFCFKCKFLHFPATCEETEKWTARPFGEGIKPCPRCKVRTVKDECCVHMIWP